GDVYKRQPSGHVAILGLNGSGKSTLLQMIAGYVQPSAGKISFYADDVLIEEENIFHYVSLAAPYLELIEEYSLEEMVKFHYGFKNIINGMNSNDVIERSGLSSSTNKQVKNFSSGMKQRLKLALAILSDTPLLLLDEPLSNLDEQGELWYQQMVKDFSLERTVVVCSNMNEKEFGFCGEKIMLKKIDVKI
ncbi:MAG: ATP-binding cassette domain-containing protein, partial [Bacteroidia bacterium]|nr:ATP-binding cassette domain-containing protein [Bacteroidia bacterium]